MDREEFAALLDRFTRAAEAGDGEAFAACFTEDGVYHDYIYGDHVGRKEIAHMMTHLFHGDAGPDYRWEMFDPGERRSRLRLVAVELHIHARGIRGQARDHRRHEQVPPARRAHLRLCGIRERRNRDGATRRRAGAHGESVPQMGRLARGAAGNGGISGAGEGDAAKVSAASPRVQMATGSGRSAFQKALPQRRLVHLAGRVARQGVDEHDARRAFESREAFAAMRDHLRLGQLLPGFTATMASPVSPHVSSGAPITAASATCGIW